MSAPGQLLCGESSLARSLACSRCAICGKRRKLRFLGVEFYDIGVLHGVRRGIVGVNVRYCKDDPRCVAGAMNWSVKR